METLNCVRTSLREYINAFARAIVLLNYEMILRVAGGATAS